MADNSINLSHLSAEEKRALLTKLLLERAEKSASSHPLSYGQAALWFLYRLAPQSAAYNIMYAARIRGALDVPALERAAQALTDRHPMLRTTYAAREGRPVQLTHPHRRADFNVREAAGCDDEYLEGWLREEAARPFDLQTGPVLRINLLARAAGEHILLLTLHHIAVDFWSLDVLLDELRTLYAAGGVDQLPAPVRQYVDHVNWEAQMLRGAEGEALWNYWREQLGGDLPTLHLPAARGRPAVQTYNGAVQHFTLNRALTRSLKELARAEGTTLYVLLLSAFFTLLHRYSGQDDILIGTPTANRGRAGFEGVVGYFVNQVVLRPDLAGDPTFGSFLQRVRGTVLDALAHQDYPFSLLVERLRPARDLGHSPLCQVSFVWEQPRRFGDEAGARVAQSGADAPTGRDGLRLETIAVGQGGAPIELMLLISEREEALSAALQYNTDLFDAETMARMAGHLETLLGGIVTNPGARLRELPLLSDAERRQLVGWNATAVERHSKRCLHQFVEAQAQRTPQAVAVSFREQELTYRELNRQGNRLARRLRALGVGPETIVAVCLERSLDAVVSLLGILKAGGAFLPLDPTYPLERLATILEDAQAPVCLTQQRTLERLPQTGCHFVCVESAGEAGAGESDDEDGACLTSPDNLAYVIYTSGSTGRPKGVLNTHHAICNRLLWMQDEYQLTGADRVLQKTPMSFDVSVWEFFWPLMVGARLVVAEPAGHKDSAYLVRTIVEQGITTIHFVPSMLRVFLADPGAAACRSLRQVFCSGEALPFDLQERFLADSGAELHNLYGPTEAAVDVTSYRCRRGARGPVVPIGRPIANIQIHLLDSGLRRVPVGVPGELFIGGDGVARGYVNRPALTASQFLPDPFSGRPGARLYRTGDLACHLPAGDIEYLGRIDYQVKIRGVRIEPGEVEAALLQHPAVRESVVVAVADREPGQRLVAYVVPATGTSPTASELRRFLLEKLPDTMVPSVFVPLGALPLTSSGKIDRRALPAPDSARPALEAAYVAPRNPAEELLAAIWRQVLKLEQVGVHDSFFALGGASTQSLEVAARANAAGLALTPESVFRYETIAELAAAYGGEGADAPGRRPEAFAEALTPAPAPTAPPPPAAPPQEAKGNTVIESLGVYLPPKVMSTEEVLRGCEREVLMPLERLTGIRSRRVAGDGEFSIDLARRAVADCLAKSSFAAEEIDLLVCCNISRYDGPAHRFTYEPSTAVQLRKQFGFERALAFDITNACAGMFTGIAVVDAFLKAGLIRSGMVVSGEYLTNLTETAQKEIEDFMDKRLACLTVGDAGAALILRRAADCRVGFHDIDMYTLSRYSSLCIAKATDQAHGGAIMLTDSVKQTALAVKHSVSHAACVMQKGGWSPEEFQHLIMHQTSESSLNDGIVAINRLFKKQVAHTGNTIYNLAERGNTASTTHFVAIGDHISNNRIRSGDKVLFSITGSGQTIGVALYTFDDLPDRLRQARPNEHQRRTRAARPPAAHPGPPPPRVYIESVGTAPAGQSPARNSVELATQAAAACLEGSSLHSGDLGLLIHAGVYRDEFISEPAIAALVAGELKINDDVQPTDERKTFAFDVLNGGLGFLNACQIAIQMIAADKCRNAMIVASEIENNKRAGAKKLRGLKEAGSAIILSKPQNGATGFGRFVFKYHTQRGDALASYTRHEAGKTYLAVEADPHLNDYYLEYIPEAVEELLTLEGLEPSAVKVIFPPQISSAFLSRLSARMGLPQDRFVDVAAGGEDYFTSSLAFGWQQAQVQQLAGPGDIGLFIGVGSGLQVGCATYYF